VQKVSRYGGTLLALWGLGSMVGFILSRTKGNLELGRAFQRSLTWWIYTVAVIAVVMLAFGAFFSVRSWLGFGGEEGADDVPEDQEQADLHQRPKGPGAAR
jgi:hypothetical protein